MNKSFVAAAALAAALGTSPVLAADPGLVLVDTTGGHVWDGFYAGVVGGVWSGNSVYLLGGGTLGANFTVTNGLVLGVEGRGVVYSDSDIGFDATFRVGVPVANDVLIYGDGGLGMRDGSSHFFGGAGAEFALVDNLSLDGRVEIVSGSGFTAIRGTAALNFHF